MESVSKMVFGGFQRPNRRLSRHRGERFFRTRRKLWDWKVIRRSEGDLDNSIIFVTKISKLATYDAKS